MSGIQHPYFSNPSFATDGPPSPTPTRLKKRKREDDEEEASTPTKARLRIASDQLGGLALPLERPVAPYARSSHISSPQKQPMTPTSLLKENNLVMTSTPHIPPALPRQDSSSDSLSLLTRSAAPPSPTMRTRAATTPMRLALPLASLALSMPYLLIQPPTSPQHYPSLEASITALRRILSTADDPSPEMALSPEQECFAWVMLAELGIQLVSSFNSSSPSVKEENSSPKKSKADVYVPEWGLKVEEIEDAIARALQLSDRFASLKHLRHRLTLMHAQLALYQDNPKHARVLIKRLLPLSNAAQPIPTDKVWAAYEAHLAIVHSLIGQSEPSDGIRVRESDLAAALSQLNALAMLANGHGDYAVYQLAIVTKWTTLFQHHSTSESEHVTASKLDAALAEAELVLGMDGFDKQLSASTDEKSEEKEKNVSSNITPGPSGQSAGNATPLVQDLLASGGPIHVSANFKTPAFSLPTNPLGMDVYAAVMSESGQPLQSMVDEKSSDMIIPPYMRYLRVHVLMLGVLWLTHCGQSVRCSERLALLHEMMDKMNDLSKDDSDGWAGGDEMGIIQVPVSSNPEQPLRIKVTHPRVLYQLTFAISASAKRDGAGKRPKRKIFVEEGLRVGSVDDPRTSNPTLSILEGGPLLSFGRGLGVADSVHAQRAIAYIRAINYCELISVCLIRSEFDDADRYLNETVSYIRAVDNNNSSAVADTATGNGHPLTEGGDLWKAFAPRVTLLHGQLAHALGKAPLALECYRIAAYMDERSNGNAGLSVIGALAVAGEVFVRVGLLKQGGEPFQFQGEVDDEQSILELASEVSEGCLQGAWGEGMIVVGRIIAAAVTDEVIRAK
ncbi:SubName: Full=Uncharacterized protein {ECO:0000313/EMBL:CCA73937.1} [Serendipita indica DSM 11827]|nr:SubName: Full=Uncharacterized protein {ECO:0000313/EMBL:CCA73937.1} [Serendipita indica DSM 11827]